MRVALDDKGKYNLSITVLFTSDKTKRKVSCGIPAQYINSTTAIKIVPKSDNKKDIDDFGPPGNCKLDPAS